MENKSKKILFLINKLGVGGAERVFVNDVNALNGMGFDVYLATLFGRQEDQTMLSEVNIPSQNIFHINSKNIKDFSLYKKLISILKDEKIDKIISTLNEANLVARVVSLLLPKLDVFIREANVAGPKPIKFKFLDILLNLFVRKIICVSEEVRKSLQKYQPFYKNKMVVLMNGVFVPNVEKNYDSSSKVVKILNVGSLNPKKGQTYFIEALGKIKKEGVAFEACIYGKGIEESNLKNRIIEMGLENDISIKSPVPQAQLSKEYLGADIFVLSSLWEGCPNVLLEAMAHGTASVSTDVSGARDIVVDGESGFVVPIRDVDFMSRRIIELAKDPGLRETFGIAAKNRILHEYSIDKHIKRLINFIYEEAC